MLEQADISGRVSQDAEPPFLCLPGDAARGCLLLCDHATNYVPPELENLGMDAAQMQRHIAYDIGAAGVTERMATLLQAPAVLANFSRLLIDPNRGEDDPTLVMRLSDGAVVPGNAAIDEAEIARRVETWYRPYHLAIDEAIDACIDAGTVPVIVSIHTFTERWRGRERPWQAGILWDRDPRLAVPLIDALRKDPALTVGDNQPYTGKLKNDCMYKHATGRGLAHALVEIRQDLVRDAAGQMEWAERLSEALSGILGAPGAGDRLRKIEFFGSETDPENGRGNGAAMDGED